MFYDQFRKAKGRHLRKVRGDERRVEKRHCNLIYKEIGRFNIIQGM